MKTQTKQTNYVIVVDFDSRNNYLEDQCLLGWNNKYDWYDTDTYGDELLTPKGNIKKNNGLCLFIDKWVGLYVSDNQSILQDYSDSGNKEDINCTVCEIKKDTDGEWIVVPV